MSENKGKHIVAAVSKPSKSSIVEIIGKTLKRDGIKFIRTDDDCYECLLETNGLLSLLQLKYELLSNSEVMIKIVLPFAINKQNENGCLRYLMYANRNLSRGAFEIDDRGIVLFRDNISFFNSPPCEAVVRQISEYVLYEVQRYAKGLLNVAIAKENPKKEVSKAEKKKLQDFANGLRHSKKIPNKNLGDIPMMIPEDIDNYLPWASE